MRRSIPLLAVLLASCAVGPQYSRPALDVPDAFRDQTGAPTKESLADLSWWDVYRDPTLRDLLEAAVDQNRDIKIAAARVSEARAPRRGDVVVFETPSAARRLCGSSGIYVKRLIGLPGDVWSERDGVVYIDGRRLDEPYLEQSRRDAETLPPRRIRPGEYFFMGDNRRRSCDSRRWGTVPRHDIIGPVFATYWPPGRIGFR